MSERPRIGSLPASCRLAAPGLAVRVEKGFEIELLRTELELWNMVRCWKRACPVALVNARPMRTPAYHACAIHFKPCNCNRVTPGRARCAHVLRMWQKQLFDVRRGSLMRFYAVATGTRVGTTVARG